jgi:hypothetical protein
MAQFCTKCGSPQVEGAQFCTNCGAATGAGSPPFAPPPVALSTPGGAMATPAQIPPAVTPRPSSGNSAVKIILLVIAILLLLGLLSAGACVYFFYRTRQRIHQFQHQVNSSFPGSVATPGAPPNIGSAAGVDGSSLAYPGATAKGGASLAMGAYQMQQYVSDDPVDKVINFYKQKLGSKAYVQEAEGRAVLQVGGSDGAFNIVIAPDAAQGKTQITITRIGK